MSSLSEIIYEEIEGTSGAYGWGKYGEFKVLIRKSDGYINATKLCFDGNKRFSNWSQCVGMDELLMKLCSAAGIPAAELLTPVSGGKNTVIRGTYAHPKLIPHIASWVSVEFSIMVSEIVNNFVVKEYKDELRRIQEQLGQKQDKIDELLSDTKKILIKTDRLEKQNDGLKEQNDGLKEQNDGLKDQNTLLLSKLDLANENIIEAVRGVHHANNGIRGVQRKLDITSNASVPPQHVQDKDEETYAIYFDRDRLYTQCLARPFHLRRRVAELEARYAAFREVVSFKPVPNARTLASEFERRIQERGAAFDLRYQTINLGDTDITEQEMVDLARQVFEERNEPAADAKEEYAAIDLDVDNQGRIKASLAAAAAPEEVKEPAGPTRAEEFTALFQRKLDELKNIARSFPRNKEAGGWSGKAKTELVNWILRRRGIE